jgi:aryl-phospho-beta-D-glucosidase BglC (GH1 family)
MKNRKFDIKKDFQELNELQNQIMPLIDKMSYKNALNQDEEDYKKQLLKNYVRIIFFNQFKN